MRALVFLAVISGAAALQTQNYYIPMRVEPNEQSQVTLDHLGKLLEFAKKSKMSANMQMWIRTATQKVTETIATNAQEATEEKKHKEAEKKKRSEPQGPTAFSVVAGHKPDFDTQVGVKRLKGSGAKKANVKRYKPEDFKTKLQAGKVDLRKPFIIAGGMGDVEDLQHRFTALSLLDNKDVRVRYLSPVKAKEKRTFDKQQQQNPNEEQMEHQLINTEKYLVNCFNLRAKPDFRRLGGTQTEHCEMSLPVSSLYPNMTDYTLDTVGEMSGFAALEKGRSAFAARANELNDLVPDHMSLNEQLRQDSSNHFVFGPSGSGEQLRQDGNSFVDGLIHGKKRWFLMAPKDFNKLRGEAREVLEPASAFVFFEQQLEELIDDYELGSEIKYWEVNQMPGDIIFIPGDLIMTSLAYSDSFSYKQRVAFPHEIPGQVNRKIWDPESGEVPRGFQFAVCHNMDVTAAGNQLGTQLHPQQAGMIGQVFKQFFPQKQAQNHLIIQMLSECAAALEAGIKDTYCTAAFTPCLKQLKQNAKSLGKEVPSWVGRAPTGKEEL